MWSKVAKRRKKSNWSEWSKFPSDIISLTTKFHIEVLQTQVNGLFFIYY